MADVEKFLEKFSHYSDYGKVITFIEQNGGERLGVVGQLDDIPPVFLEAVKFADRGLIIAHDKIAQKVGIYSFVGEQDAPVADDMRFLNQLLESAQ